MNDADREVDEVTPYLWDKTGPADPELVRLEATLGKLKHDAPLRWPGAKPEPAPALRSARARVVVVALFSTALAAAAAVVLYLRLSAAGAEHVAASSVAATVLSQSIASEREGARPTCADPTREGFRYRAASGAPHCDGGAAGASGVVPKGAWLETDGSTSVTLDVADIGHVDVDPDSRVRVVETNLKQHRLELGRGRLHAKIDAPPRLFFVDTKAATAVDLGCEYSIEVDERGAGILKVTLGFVELELPSTQARSGRPATLVPRAAECPIDPERGPGTPVWSRSPVELRASLAAFDRSGDVGALDRALAGLGQRDSLTLFHLLTRVPDDRRAAVLDKLEAIEKAPPKARRAATLANEPAAIAAWRVALEPRWFPKPK